MTVNLCLIAPCGVTNLEIKPMTEVTEKTDRNSDPQGRNEAVVMSCEKLGMYEVFNNEYPKIVVGDFSICKQDEKSVWIQHRSGEGAQFANEKFEKAIKKFYDDNF